MIEYAKKLRVPATIGVLAVICVYVVVAVVYFIVLLSGGTYIADAARQAGSDTVSLVWIFTAVALVLICLLSNPPVAKIAQLVRASAMVVSGATAAALIFWIMGLFGDFGVGAWLATLGGLVETLVKAACSVALWRLLRWPVDRPSDSADPTSAQTGEPASESGQRPAWDAPEAVGLQWNRAGDAATGAAPPALHATPDAVPEPPATPAKPRQLWSRGGIPAEALPSGDEQQPASQSETRPPDDSQRPSTGQGGRPAPDWTPTPRPE